MPIHTFSKRDWNLLSTKRVYFIAPLPPPLHGQSHASKSLLDLLPISQVTRINIGGGGTSFVPDIPKRIFQHLLAWLTLLIRERGTAYLSVNANAGMWLTVALALAARVRRHRIVFHHHTAGHTQMRLRAMSALCSSGGNDAYHIVICDAMKDGIVKWYSIGECQVLTLSNVGFVEDSLWSMDRSLNHKTKLTVGHLSNLTLDKGVGRVLDSFRELTRNKICDRLILAGPALDPVVLDLIEAAQLEFKSSFIYRGLVDGNQKKEFFRDIDLFLFPSLYKSETQGIVNLEALASGVPVAAFALCCITSDITSECGIAIDPEDAFETAIIPFARNVLLMGRRAALLSRTRFSELRAQFDNEIDVVAKVILQIGVK